MIAESDFKSFFDRELIKTVASLEEYRKKHARILRKRFRIALLLFFIIAIGIYIGEPLAIFFASIPSTFFFAYTYQKYSDMNKYLRNRYKYKVLIKAIGFYFEHFDYIANQKIAKSVLLKSMLFHGNIYAVKGEDFMQFKIGNTFIMFCETRIYGMREKLKFKGVFISSSFHKYFNTQTFVVSRKTSDIAFRIKRQLLNKMKKIKLENPEFDKLFHTFSADQVEARYILSTSLMQRILDYQKKIKNPLSMSFVKNRMYCTLPNYTDLFEAPMLKPIDYNYIQKSIEPVLLYTAIVEDLNLNLRIWSKH